MKKKPRPILHQEAPGLLNHWETPMAYALAPTRNPFDTLENMRHVEPQDPGSLAVSKQ